MGELLRAICDATALDANTAFYSVGVAQTTTVTGATTFARRNAFLQCKTDTWFLLMGWTMNTSQVQAAGPGNWDAKASAAQFTIQDAKTSFVYSNLPVPKVNQGFTLNNMVWLPEYILWPPSSLINFIEDINVTTIATALAKVNYITLTGIEYKMPEGY